jgi:serine phosphatase RsbU (regulator of sigma subunit)
MRGAHSSLFYHGVGATATALVFLLIILVKTVVRPEFPGQIAGPLFLLAVVSSAWYGGVWPGLFTAVLSYLALDYFFLPTVHSLDPGWADIPIGGIYLSAALVVSTLQARQRRAEETAGRLKERMRLARRIQLRLLPQAAPNIPGFDIAGTFLPAEETGGDFFDFISMRDGRICLVVGDVAGHGLPAALLMVKAHASLRALALTHESVGEILTLTNAMLVDSTEDDVLVTLFIACIRPSDRSLVYAGAGHEARLLHASGRCDRMRSTSPPLGLEKEVVVPEVSGLFLEDGDVLLLSTDGIHEAHSKRGEQFGFDRTIAALSGNRTQSAGEMVDRLIEGVQAFFAQMPQADDMTAVVLKVNGQESRCKN